MVEPEAGCPRVRTATDRRRRRGATPRSAPSSVTSRLPTLPRGGLPDRVAPGRARQGRAARVPLRPGAGHRRGRRGRSVAGPGRPDAAPLARARRGHVLLHVLLRLRHPLLSGTGEAAAATARRRRPSGGSAPAGATEELRLLRPQLVLTVGGLAAQALVGARSLTECIGKSYLIDERDHDPAPAPLRRERMAQRPGQPQAAGEGADARAPRDRAPRRAPDPAAAASARPCATMPPWRPTASSTRTRPHSTRRSSSASTAPSPPRRSARPG